MSFQPLKEYLNNVVRIITIDGRTYQGFLAAIDNQTNLVLTHTEERVIQTAESGKDNEITEPGLIMIRGDLVLLCGLVDEQMDSEIDWMKVKGGPIGSTKHT